MDWLRPDEAAAWLHATPQHIWTLASRHKWRRRKEGKTVRYHPADVEQTLKQRTPKE